MESVATRRIPDVRGMKDSGKRGLHHEGRERFSYNFQMPLHYPRYSKADYEEMPEWRLDRLLAEYGMPVTGDLSHKRKFAVGAFLWHPY